MQEDNCPKCSECENIHANYDWSKSDRPVEEYLCNECGTYFPPTVNKSQPTAIDWLYDQIDSKGKCIYDVLDQARALHKKQIEQAHLDGGKNQRTAVKYYEETFNPQTKK